MFSRYEEFRDVKRRRIFLQIHPAVEIESIIGYDKLPEIKPVNKGEIFFYKDGFEAVISEESVKNPERSDERQYRGLLVNQTDKDIIAFSYRGAQFDPIMKPKVYERFGKRKLSKILKL